MCFIKTYSTPAEEVIKQDASSDVQEVHLRKEVIKQEVIKHNVLPSFPSGKKSVFIYSVIVLYAHFYAIKGTEKLYLHNTLGTELTYNKDYAEILYIYIYYKLYK